MSDAAVTAIVLAGDRGPGDPLVKAAGVPCKAVIPIDGELMILRVVAALRAAGVDDILLCGPRPEVVADTPALATLVEASDIRWMDFAPTPCASAIAALEQADTDSPVLLTTADHALLKPEVVRTFIDDALATDCDLGFGVVRHADVMTAFPGVRRTAHRLRGDAWCGCNLFLLKTPRARTAVDYWRRIEALRKRPWKAAQMIGWGFLARYATRRMSLDQAATEVGARIGITARPVRVHDAETAVDVDSVRDWEFVKGLFEPAREA